MSTSCSIKSPNNFPTQDFARFLLPIMIGAALQHIGNGWVFSGKDGGWEFPVFWTVMLFLQSLLGDGAYAWRPSSLPGRRADPAPRSNL